MALVLGLSAMAKDKALEKPLKKDLPAIYQPYELGKNEVLFSTTKIRINAVNPNSRTNPSGAYFPGGRGADQLVIYTPEYGTNTNTNEFGAEAIVEDNIVTEISGADSFIPANGIVISGHGKAKTWLNSALSIGTRIYIDNDTLYTYTTSESYIFESQKKINEAEAMIKFYSETNPNYNKKVPNSYINSAKDYLKKAAKDSEQVQEYSRLAIEAANDAINSAIPYKNGELRGVWVRPTEKTTDDIIKSIETIDAAGIDNIFLETYYHGKTIFPSKTMESYGFTPQYEQFDCLDVLQVWIDEAHKRDMKVHIWFETFYVGNKPLSQQNILASKPDWGNKLKRDYASNEPSKSSSEHNGYFLDPANPAVQEFLLKLVEEILTRYKPDGINLDYIRYPNATAGSANLWGYTETARREFQSQFKADPVDFTASDPLWEEWNNYRRSKVTDFVKKAGELCKKRKTYLSAVIFPDRASALSTKQQDWKTWSDNGYLRGFTPLFLTCDSKMASSMMRKVIDAKSSETELFAGLFVTFMNGSPEDLIRQIHEARKLNTNGIIIFDYAHLESKYSTALTSSVFKTEEPEVCEPPAPEKPKKRWWKFWQRTKQ
jgi:uncharacterized lipoprotein YddW (UPF0748 family)